MFADLSGVTVPSFPVFMSSLLSAGAGVADRDFAGGFAIGVAGFALTAPAFTETGIVSNSWTASLGSSRTHILVISTSTEASSLGR